MTLYYIKGRDRTGRIVASFVDVPDKYKAYLWLKERNMTPIRFHRAYVREIFKPRIKSTELIDFSRDMHYILRAGVSVLDGLEEIKKNTKNQTFKQVIDALIRDIEVGRSLSDALSCHPYIFPEYYVAIVRAGESVGRLDMIFKELVDYLSWLEDNKNKVKQALIYPIIVCILISIALIIFIIFVIPKLTSFLLELDMPLPLSTKMLIYFNNFVLVHWYLFVFVFFLLIVFVFFSHFSERIMYKWDSLKLKIPYIGNVFFNLIMARFVRYIGLLYKSGIQIYSALDLIEEVINNRFYIKKIKEIKRYLGEGHQLANALDMAGDFPSFLVRSIGVGENTGTLDSSFEDLTVFFNDSLDRAVKKITTIIEPTLLIFVATIILLIVISVLYPIYNMLGKIK